MKSPGFFCLLYSNRQTQQEFIILNKILKMDLQARKILFVQEFLRLQNEDEVI